MRAVPWRPMMLRESRVLARCDEHGSPVVASGRVEIRYKEGASKSYQAGARNLVAIEGEAVLPDSACEGEPSAPTKRGSKVAPASSGAGVPATTASDGLAIAYADGACSGNPGPCGIGVVLLLEDGSRHELSEYLGEGTNNVAELTAVQRVAHLVHERREKAVRVYTDSRYSIGVLSLGWKAKANVDLIRDVKATLKKAGRVELVHVPGHAGVILNERADTLARLAVDSRASTGWVEITPRTPLRRT